MHRRPRSEAFFEPQLGSLLSWPLAKWHLRDQRPRLLGLARPVPHLKVASVRLRPLSERYLKRKFDLRLHSAVADPIVGLGAGSSDPTSRSNIRSRTFSATSPTWARWGQRPGFLASGHIQLRSRQLTGRSGWHPVGSCEKPWRATLPRRCRDAQLAAVVNSLHRLRFWSERRPCLSRICICTRSTRSSTVRFA